MGRAIWTCGLAVLVGCGSTRSVPEPAALPRHTPEGTATAHEPEGWKTARAASPNCAEVPNCSAPGCTDVAGVCTDASLEGCRVSHHCEVFGRCGFDGTDCIAVSDQDCAASIACEEAGLCARNAAACAPKNRGHCVSSRECTDFGRCSYAEGACSAVSAADCQNSSMCEGVGRCHPVGGECLALDQRDCEGPCRASGLCHLDSSGLCAAKTDADCQQAEDCKKEEFCWYDSGQCTWRASDAK